MQNTLVTVGFVSNDTIQIRMELGNVIDSKLEIADVPQGWSGYHAVEWTENGSVYKQHDGKYVGEHGEYFMPFDIFEASSIADLFVTANGPGSAFADRVSSWSIAIDGQPVSIEKLSRKASIIDMAQVRDDPLLASDFQEGAYNSNTAYKTVQNVFIKLSAPIPKGAAISINLNDPDFATVHGTFSPDSIISEAIHVNLTGFDPDDIVKFATLSSWNGVLVAQNSAMTSNAQLYDGAPTYKIIDILTNTIVKTGTAFLVQAYDPSSNVANREGTEVWKMDFSQITDKGTYAVLVDGIGISQSFTISDDHWAEIFDVALSGFYHQRSGIALEAEYTSWTRPASLHTEGGTKVTVYQSTYAPNVSRDNDPDLPSRFSELVSHATTTVLEDAWGGWHDAGDWDRRIQHVEAARKLIEIAELSPDFAKNRQASIPENANGIPDVVDEAMWTLDFFRRIQQADGGVSYGVEGANLPGWGDASWAVDDVVLYAFAPTKWSSWEYAASAAKLGNILKQYDPSQVTLWQNSAIAAMQWAEQAALTGTPLTAEETNSRNLAAAELFRLTGDTQWGSIYEQTSIYNSATYGRSQLEAAYVYSQIVGSKNGHLNDNGVAAILHEADYVYNNNPQNPFGYTYSYSGTNFGMAGTQSHIAAQVFVRAYELSEDDRFLSRLLEEVQYTLGSNPLNQAYLTGLGVRQPNEILNFDAEALGGTPPPGLLIYGDYKVDSWWNDPHLQSSVWPGLEFIPLSESYQADFHHYMSSEYTVWQGMADFTYIVGYLAGLQGDNNGGGPNPGGSHGNIGGAYGGYFGGTSQNDQLTYHGGSNNYADGGAGVDWLIFSGNIAEYTILGEGSHFTIRGAATTDHIQFTNFEYLSFADVKNVSLAEVPIYSGQQPEAYWQSAVNIGNLVPKVAFIGSSNGYFGGSGRNDQLNFGGGTYNYGDGGGGIDWITFSGNIADYTILGEGNHFTIRGVATNDHIQFTNFEYLSFADEKNVSLADLVANSGQPAGSYWPAAVNVSSLILNDSALVAVNDETSGAPDTLYFAARKFGSLPETVSHTSSNNIVQGSYNERNQNTLALQPSFNSDNSFDYAIFDGAVDMAILPAMDEFSASTDGIWYDPEQIGGLL
ncbi:glycoside hydrolase family 9 protein [Brucella intermedia]|uniref:glycoside hydrolase family 9 protein n=1 Tax=Brucella intermedia TaxID=94625 RepID=UPI001E549D6C|nr:glycoside hydrolase family 9 protein [Brucella intermedia]MCB4920790.1 glycoside hydrolase family 9 protein [Brucella intermedia]